MLVSMSASVFATIIDHNKIGITTNSVTSMTNEALIYYGVIR